MAGFFHSRAQIYCAFPLSHSVAMPSAAMAGSVLMASRKARLKGNLTGKTES
jgi:hypothetical protein